jgi:O-antigen ligase
MVHLLRIAGYTVVFLLVRELVWRSRRHWVAAAPLVMTAFLEAALGLVQVTIGETGTHARGTYVNRNHFAGLLELALPLAVMYPITVLGRGSEPRVSQVRPAAWACAGFAVAAVILLGIIYSLSRTGFLASLTSLFVMGLVALGAGRPRWRKFVAVGVVAAVIVLGFIFLPPDQLVKRLAQIASTEKVTAEARLSLWRETLDLIAAYPVFGCGLGGYESAFLKYKRSEPLVTDDYAHNDYLQLLAETGGLGFSIAAALLVAILARAAGGLARRSSIETRCLALASMGAFIAILIHSFADFNLYIPGNGMALAWIAGIVAGLEFSAAERRQSVRALPDIVEVRAVP